MNRFPTLPRSSSFRHIAAAVLCATGLLLVTSAQAGLLDVDPDAPQWQEAEVPPPPAFNVDKTVSFDVSHNSELSHSIDPSTLSVGNDGVVRYVRVARSRQGALNAAYEGVRCSSGEVRTYAYWNPGNSSWQQTPQAAWRSLYDSAGSLPAKALARDALCDGASVNGKTDKMLRDLRYGKKP